MLARRYEFHVLVARTQREVAAVNLSPFAFTRKPFVPSKRKVQFAYILHNVINTELNRKILNLTQSSILM